MFSKDIFGARLLALRTEKGIPQAKIAELLGVSTTQVGDMERGNSGTTLERLVKLSEFYHVSTDYILGLKDIKK